MVKKVICIVVLAALLAAGLPVSAQEITTFVPPTAADYIKEQRIFGREEGLELSGNRPYFDGLPSLSLQEKLNQSINQVIQAKKNAAKEAKARSISFRSYYIEDGDIKSLLLETTITSVSPRIEMNSFNYDFAQEKMVTIEDVMGPNGVQVATNVINARVKQSPGAYNTNFPGVKYNQSFYTSEGSIFFLFDEYQIAAGSAVKSFEVKLAKIKNVTVPKKDYLEKTSYYNLKMIPLRKVCETFGYNLSWNPHSAMIEIRSGNQFIISITVGKNGYFKDSSLERGSMLTLESAPEINPEDNLTYVPLSFFSKILGLAYSVDKDGNVMFSSYEE